jgi:hypothetical protein
VGVGLEMHFWMDEHDSTSALYREVIKLGRMRPGKGSIGAVSGEYGQRLASCDDIPPLSFSVERYR